MNKGRKRGQRPNVVPSKQVKFSTKSEIVESSRYDRTLKMRQRWLIQDMCDLCLKIVYFKKNAIRLRLKGWRMSCWDCVEFHKLDFKKDKIFVEANLKSKRKKNN